MAFLTITFSSHRHFQCCMQWFVFQEENGCCKKKVSLINKLGKSYMKQVFVPFFNVGLVRASNTSTGRGEKKVNCVFQAKNHQHGKSRYEDIKSRQFTGLTYFRPMFHWGQLNLWMMLSILKILCFFSIALCSFDVRHHIRFCPTKRGIILIIDLRDIFNKIVSKSTYGYGCPWVLLYQKHNSQKLGLEDSPTSEEREMPRRPFERGLK